LILTVDVDELERLAAEARTALAQPEPEVAGVTDDELLRCYGLAKRDHCYEGPMDDWPKRAERAATVHGLRAVLTRYARPTIEPEGVTDEEIEREALKNADSDDEYRAFKSGAFFVQERISHPTTEPVPVSERPWEREGWCDAEGFCWEGSGWTYDDANEVEGYATWTLVPANEIRGDVSLPHHALPVPGAEVGS
jgi:hypothetical protein